MKESTRIQIENMKNQTFGVEIEGNNITRQKAAQKAAEYSGRPVRVHRKEKRIFHLERMGRAGQGMEIPEGCQHCRTGRPEMRDGHPNPHLRGHGASAGAGESPPESGDEE